LLEPAAGAGGGGPGAAGTRLPIRRARKLEIEEELLAHLHAIYEEELACSPEPGRAAERAVQRFGDPDDLQRELRAAVPIREWLAFAVLERGPRMGRWIALAGAAAVLVGLGFVFPAVAYLRNIIDTMGGQSSTFHQSITLLILGVAITLLGAASMVLGIVNTVRLRNLRR
jgi:hypothetical protein